MHNQNWKVICVSLCLLAVMLACGSFSAPEDCGDNIGGTADDTLFGRYFESMDLVDAVTWQPGISGENGSVFSNDENLLIMFDAAENVEIRACIQQTVGAGQITFDQTNAFQSGSNEFALGNFDPGTYVIRVIVNGILVRNFPFQVD